MSIPLIGSFLLEEAQARRRPSRKASSFRPESGIDYAEHAPCRAVIWLSLDVFLHAPRVQQ